MVCPTAGQVSRHRQAPLIIAPDSFCHRSMAMRSFCGPVENGYRFLHAIRVQVETQPLKLSRPTAPPSAVPFLPGQRTLRPPCNRPKSSTSFPNG
ncbi:hypothetical protein M514_01783 [Trichuris suis]|uniref:Uncharacterized protein n=1 Tax=Trichuris suis TaxID=68888 RepID=A0A085NT65_9BILA|nr:hypothetical protein M513_01783 [Trichuris suis]KFD72661.1 hypothetical protein M514_01783 [Trichuris suis]